MTPLRRRGPGRPRIAEGEVTEERNLRLPASMHQEVCVIALNRRMSVNAVIRAAIQRLIDSQKPEAHP